MGELTSAVRNKHMVMGLYYSGGRDWSFDYTLNPEKMTPGVPQSEEYAAYAEAHIRELFTKYKPCILWNDMGYPRFEKEKNLYNIFAKLFNEVCPGASLTNNRWGMHSNSRKMRYGGDFQTPEYTHLEEVAEEAWEMNRGLGFSFGYNRIEGEEETISVGNLTRLLIDVVSKNGNMLLDLAPLPNGSFSAIQTNRLHDLAKFMSVYDRTIQFSRPFLPVGSKPSGNYRFTRSKRSDKLFIHVMHPDVVSSQYIVPIGIHDESESSFYEASVILHDGKVEPLVVQTRNKETVFTLPYVYHSENDWPICIVLYNLEKNRKQTLFQVWSDVEAN